MSTALLNIAKRAAFEAGRIIRDAYRNKKDVTVSTKAMNDYVTNVDQEAERAIISIIKKSRPGDFIVGEETASTFRPHEYKQAGKATWIIDPIDGTRNFVEGEPHFAVSIAVQQNGETVAAIVYNPILEDVWEAVPGETKYNDRRVRISQSPRGSGINGKLLGSGFNYKEKSLIKDQTKLLDALFDKGMGDFRAKGAAALGLCAAAMGWIHCYYEKGVKPWDVAAGAFIVSEAGGVVMDFQAGNRYLSSGEIIAGELEAVKATAQVINRFYRGRQEQHVYLDDIQELDGK